MHEAWEQWEGQIVDGRFLLRQYLGGSQQSAVFLTEYDRPEPQNAAIKLVVVDSANTELQLSRWKLGADLSHPHLIRIFETGRAQLRNIGLFYVVMEYAEETLSQVLRHRALTPAEACDMLGPAVDALAYLHGKGLVHGHLKPANIMAVNDQLKVSSDGLYRAGEGSDRPEEPSAYDPPDVAQGMSPPGDVWSLGVTLVEALTQRLPVQERPEKEEPVLPETLSRPIVDIAHQCLRRDRWLRWTVADIAARLREISVERLVPTTRAPEPISKRRYVTLAAIIGVALALGVAKLVNRHGDAPRSSSTQFEQPSAQPESPNRPATSDLGQSTKKGTSDEKSVLPGGSPSTTPLRPEAKSTPGASSPGEVVKQVLPDVPVKTRNDIRGTVRVRVRARVDPSGSVVGTELDSAGPSKYFAGLALQAARSWKFRAAKVKGRDVSSEWLLRFAFSQSRTTAVPLQTDP
jgi:TonB family protein